ncbi:patatin-like phospholipase family protein [soil metagenome]
MPPYTSPTGKRPGELALVMGGGGARAAYQVGMLRALAHRFPDLEIPIVTGVSAGAINAVHLAAHPGTFAEAVHDLSELWANLRIEHVFRVDSPSLTRNLMHWGLQLLSGGLVRGAGEMRSLVDTTPLARFLSGALGTGGRSDVPIDGIRANLASGRLRALALSTSSYTTGRSITWVEGRPGLEPWERPMRRARLEHITVDHVMASAALPLIFPAVRIGEEWYGDGGIRLSAPLSPALHLGADRILAISTRFDRSDAEEARPQVVGYPPPAQVAGQLMNAIFLDLLDQDSWRVEQTNKLLRGLPPEDRGDLRVVDIVTLRPSMDLGKLAADFEIDLPRFFRFLLRGLGTDRTRSPDLLSFVLFEPGYVCRLMDLGEQDAEARIEELKGHLRSAGEPGGSRGPASAGS